MAKRDDLDVVLEWLAKALFFLAFAGALWNLNTSDSDGQAYAGCIGSACDAGSFHVPWGLTILAVCLSAALSGVVAARQKARAKALASTAAPTSSSVPPSGPSGSGDPLSTDPPTGPQQSRGAPAFEQAWPAPTQPTPAPPIPTQPAPTQPAPTQPVEGQPVPMQVTQWPVPGPSQTQTTAGSPAQHPAVVVELKRARRNELYAAIGAFGVVVQIVFAVAK
jgi:hypothetical protein